VHDLVIEAVPAGTLGSFAIALQVLLPIIDVRVMLARNVKDLFGVGAFKDLPHGIEFFGLRRVSEITGVDHELRRIRQTVDLVYCCLPSFASCISAKSLSGDMRAASFCMIVAVGIVFIPWELRGVTSVLPVA